ncbi:MAG: 30S ribosomal protein S8 [Alphaproteobacteria bacterium MarineAlpha2_Bin1]|nr:MAG: 30S ribosomal protein S8 [Alphaproteobacteria bacterium MarineAlpha2_Bin1]
MAMSDPLADMLTRIRNGQMARLLEVTSPASKLRANVLNVLKDEGYIRDFEQLEVEVGKPELKIQLKYYDGKPVIKNIERVSCPGRRVYSGIKELPNVSSGLGIVILSTPQGVISDSRARELKVGGEILCNVV